MLATLDKAVDFLFFIFLHCLDLLLLWDLLLLFFSDNGLWIFERKGLPELPGALYSGEEGIFNARSPSTQWNRG